MALMNTALELVHRGKRVLVVDFDLEAPGIPTFKLARPDAETSGVVEFVTEYMDTAVAPDIDDFLYECELPDGLDGPLWVMPAGYQDDSYAHRLNAIDWQLLYKKREGYFLFEDLKEQWREKLAPDYVLIDSRTGHTDVGGICTRQLPDSVVALFFPNEQNLEGLSLVVDRIRSERELARDNRIAIHFVSSNVPLIDDEEEILERRLLQFQDRLKFDKLTATIHRYDSLDLIDQVVFTLERPKTKLAEEYRSLAKEICKWNAEDREGSLDLLRAIRLDDGDVHNSSQRDFPRTDTQVDRIQQSHMEDGEILFNVGRWKEEKSRFEEAAQLYVDAIEAKYANPFVYINLAIISHRLGNEETAVEALLHGLKHNETNFLDLRIGLRMLIDIDPSQLQDIEAWPAWDSVTWAEAEELCGIFLSTDEALLEAAEPIIRSHVEIASLEENTVPVDQLHMLSLNLMGQGRATEAADVIMRMGKDLTNMALRDLFNLAMATWGSSKKVPNDLFEEVVKRDLRASQEADDSPNYAQCLAVANWATGNKTAALEFSKLAAQRISHPRRNAFSCWRYLRTTPDDFLQDIEQIEKLIDGTDLTPTFVHQV